MIKERIDSLIEREYIKRDEKDRNSFIYIPWTIRRFKNHAL